jgi:hypothetical protein
MTREAVQALLTQLLSPDEAMRTFTLARFELFMEGTRRPELQPFIKDLQSAAVKSATVILESAGFDPTPAQMDELSRLLNGWVFSSLTIPGAPQPADLVDRLLGMILED